MLEEIDDEAAITDAVMRRRVVMDGFVDVSDSWLADGDKIAMAEESGRHLEEEEARDLASAFVNAGVAQLTAIAHDPVIVTEEIVCQLDSSKEDLCAFSSKYTPMSMLMLPATGTELAVLFSVDDYKVLAGPPSFVTDYFGDLDAARETFTAFANGHLLPEAQPTLQTVVRRISRDR